MSRFNRYKFIKRMYPEYLLVFETNSGYKYEGLDKDIMMNFINVIIKTDKNVKVKS